MKNMRQLCGAMVLVCALTLPALAGQMPTVTGAKGQMPTPEPHKPTATAPASGSTVEETALFDLFVEATLNTLQGVLYLF
ncbi:MAG TPA: hypothetical protein VNA19_06945 [Pyrinomonadaceae bacterium]|jgi:hypothetical protein|nr:hypothetical protein [Pyrinomonadaceae bacterium]